MDLDPSGLYLSVSTTNNKILIYALAKGSLVNEFNTDLFETSHHRFSDDG